MTKKQSRAGGDVGNAALARAAARPANALSGKTRPGPGYAPATVTHSETVLRTFYDFHLDEGTGPILNPFPLDPSSRSRRPNAHHNPMDQWQHARVGRYRPKVPRRNPRAIPDHYFEELFTRLRCNRDRALVSFWISAGVRASELLGLRNADVDPGQQLITVTRKGSRAREQVPASADSFVWLRLYQAEFERSIPPGRLQPLWWTLRKPLRPLTYHAAHRMFERANEALGSDWTLHDLRHSAAARMARDPEMRITDVQQVLGHARLSTTEIYLTPNKDDVISAALRHFARRAEHRDQPPPVQPAPGYDPTTLKILFGRRE